MTEALVTAVSPILYKSHLMREGGDAPDSGSLRAGFQYSENGASVLIPCAALEARRSLDCVFCSPMYRYVLAGARACRT